MQHDRYGTSLDHAEKEMGLMKSIDERGTPPFQDKGLASDNTDVME